MPVTPAVWLAAGAADLPSGGGARDPEIIALAGGGLVAGWAEHAPGATGGPLTLQLLDGAGAAQGAPAALWTGPDPARALTLAADPAGGFVAAWTSLGAAGSTLHLARLSASGAILGSAAFAIPGEGTTNIRAAINAAGEIYVAWDQSEGPNDRVMGRLYDSALAPLSPVREIYLDQNPGVESLGTRAADVSALPSGHFAVVLSEPDTDLGVQTHLVYSSAFVSPDRWGATGVQANVPNTAADGFAQDGPRVAALASGEIATLYAETGAGVSRLELSIMTTGSVSARVQKTVAAGASGLTSPAIAALADGGFLIAYRDGATGALVARAYDADGAEGAPLILAAAGPLAGLELSRLPDGRVAAIWEDAASGLISRAIIDPRDPASPILAPAAGGDVAAHALGGIVEGSEAADVLRGSAHADDLRGNGGADIVAGGEGDDLIAGGAGDDSLSGGAGNDVILGGPGADRIDGGAGIDAASYAGAAAGVAASLAAGGTAGEALGDTLIGIEALIGSAFADTLTGGAGDDRIEGGAGADLIDGGEGADEASFAGSAAGVEVSLTAGTAAGGDAQGDTLVSIAHLTGSAHADALTGDDGFNRLAGLGGDDILFATRGRDAYDGGAGFDTLDLLAIAGGFSGAGFAGSVRGVELLLGSELADDILTGDEGEGPQGPTGSRFDVIRTMGGADRVEILRADGMSVETGSGDDTVIVHGFAGSGAPDLVFDGGAGSDALELRLAAAAGGVLSLDAAAFRLEAVEILRLISAAGDAGALRLSTRWNPAAPSLGFGALDLTGSALADRLVVTVAADARGAGAVDLSALAVTGAGAGDGIEAIAAAGAALEYRGGDWDDIASGAEKDDLFHASFGADSYAGGAGRDAFSFSQAAAGVTATGDAAALSLDWAGRAATQTLQAVELLIGSGFADVIDATGFAEIEGGEGDDLLRIAAGGPLRLAGDGGADVLAVAASAAVLSGLILEGGAGRDALRLEGGASAPEHRVDLWTLSGVESLDLSAPGALSARLTEAQAEALEEIIGAASEARRIAVAMGAESDGVLDLSALTLDGDPEGRVTLALSGRAGLADLFLGGVAREEAQLGAGDAARLGGGADVAILTGAGITAEGGAGEDLADLAAATGGIAAMQLGAGWTRIFGGGLDGGMLAGFEALRATGFDDVLTLGDGLRRIEALGGDDLISVAAAGAVQVDAGEGDDVVEALAALDLTGASLAGGAGRDALRLTGWAGAEAFALPEAALSGFERIELRLLSGDAATLALSTLPAGIEEIALLAPGPASLIVTLDAAGGIGATPPLSLTAPAGGEATLRLLGSGATEVFDLGAPLAAGTLSVAAGGGDDEIRATTGGLWDGGAGTDRLVLPGAREDALLLLRPDGGWQAVRPGALHILSGIETIAWDAGGETDLTALPSGGEEAVQSWSLAGLASGATLVSLAGAAPEGPVAVVLEGYGAVGTIAFDAPGAQLVFTPFAGAFDPLAAGETATLDIAYSIALGGETHAAVARFAVTGEDDPARFTGPLDFSTPENTVLVGAIAAADPDGGDVILSIAGGPDSARFTLTDGLLRFAAAPDFEAPGDADGDNVYEIDIALAGGATARARVTVTDAAETPAIGEVHSLSLGSSWTSLTFDRAYENPVVFAMSPSFNEADAVATRFRNVTAAGAEVLLQETKYHLGALSPDRSHAAETVTLLVLEAGTHVLEDGTILQVGAVDTNKLYVKGFESVSYSAAFDADPAVFTQVQSFTGSDWIISRTRNGTAAGFELTMQEEEFDNLNHSTETVGWFAIESGAGSWSGIDWQAGSTGETVNGNFSAAPFLSAFDSTPNVLAALATYNGSDPASPRIGTVTATGFQVRALEDMSRDAEIAHGRERIDWIAFDGEGLLHGETQPQALAASAALLAPGPRIVAQSGAATASDRGVQVTFGTAMENPVVFAALVSARGTDPALARVSGVTGTGFFLDVQEVANGAHAPETLRWVAVEAGSWALGDGSVLSAGLTGVAAGASAALPGGDGALLAQLQSLANEGLAFAALEGDGALLRRDEAAEAAGNGMDETLGWLRLSGGDASDGLFGGTATASDAWSAVDFAAPLAAPGVIATIRESAAQDPARNPGQNPAQDPGWARIDALSTDGFLLRAEEDRALDTETAHGTAEFDWLGFETGMTWTGEALV